MKKKTEQYQEEEGYQSRYGNFNVRQKVRKIARKFRYNGSGKIIDGEVNLIITKNMNNKYGNST